MEDHIPWSPRAAFYEKLNKKFTPLSVNQTQKTYNFTSPYPCVLLRTYLANSFQNKKCCSLYERVRSERSNHICLFGLRRYGGFKPSSWASETCKIRALPPFLNLSLSKRWSQFKISCKLCHRFLYRIIFWYSLNWKNTSFVFYSNSIRFVGL